jgi:acyl-CoA thioester hydrolase
MNTETPGTTTPAPFETAVQLRWSDEDSYGHVNNVRVLQLMEEARVRALRSWGAAVERRFPQVVRSLNCDYLRPLHYGEDVRVRVWVRRIGTSSYTLRHEISQAGAVCAAGDVLMVQLNEEGTGSHPLSDSRRALFEAAFLPKE